MVNNNTEEEISLCSICGKRPANFEGVIFCECKHEQDLLDIQEERIARANSELVYNHKGRSCWINNTICCKFGWCSGCSVFISYREDYLS